MPESRAPAPTWAGTVPVVVRYWWFMYIYTRVSNMQCHATNMQCNTTQPNMRMVDRDHYSRHQSSYSHHTVIIQSSYSHRVIYIYICIYTHILICIHVHRYIIIYIYIYITTVTLTLSGRLWPTLWPARALLPGSTNPQLTCSRAEQSRAEQSRVEYIIV